MVGHRLAGAVVDHAADRDRARRARRDRVRALRPRHPDREVRTDGLRWRRREDQAPPRTASPPGRAGRCRTRTRAPSPAASRGSRSARSSACGPRSSGTELKIGSYGKSGSPGKYICVTSRCANARPSSEKWMCAGPPGVVVVAPRVGPGLDRHEAVAPLVVGHAAPGAGEVRVQRRRPAVPAVAVAARGVGLPDLDQRVAQRLALGVEDTRPETVIRSPIGSPSCWRVRSWSSSPSRAHVAERGTGHLGDRSGAGRRAAACGWRSASTCTPGSRAADAPLSSRT